MSLSSQVADFFSVLGDRNRIRILGLLHQKSLTANEISSKLGGITLPALSYQLKKLEDHHFIKHQKDLQDGRKKYFTIADNHISHILNDAISHIQGGENCEDSLNCEENVEKMITQVI